MRGVAGQNLLWRVVQTRCDSWGFRMLELSAEKRCSCARGMQIGQRSGAERNEMLCFEQGARHRAFGFASSQVLAFCGPGLMPGVDHSNLDMWNLKMCLIGQEGCQVGKGHSGLTLDS